MKTESKQDLQGGQGGIMTEDKKSNVKVQNEEQKRKKAKKLIVFAGICLVLAGLVFLLAHTLSPAKAEEKVFYVYYADCPTCKRDLPKLNPNNKYTNYEYTNDEAQIVNEIGYDNYSKLPNYRVPVKVTITKDKITYQGNPLKQGE